MTLSSYPTIANGQLDTDSPVDTDLMGVAGLQGKDRYLWDEGFSSSLHPGVQLNTAAIVEAIATHDHRDDVTSDGHATPIPAAGIAAGAILLSSMIEDNAISQALIAANTMQTANFGNLQVTPVKINGSLGYHITADPTLDQTNTTLDPGDYYWRGDTYTIANPKGALGCFFNMNGGYFYPASQDNNNIKFAAAVGKIEDDFGGFPFTGSWPSIGPHGIDCYFM